MMNENMNERQDQIWWIENICDSETDEVKGIVRQFLGPRGPLGLPSLVSSPVGAKNLDQLYSSINHHRTTANQSDIVWCMSGGVWWCLVVSDACLVVSGGVNVYRLT